MTAALTDHSLDLNVLSWALAVEKASRAANAQPPADVLPDPLADLTTDQRRALEAELHAAGLTNDDGTLTPDWQRTLTRAAEAPLTLELVARSSGVSVHCAVSLAGGSGLARISSRTVRELPDGAVVTEADGERVAVTAFSEESLWAVVSAALPDVAELTSTACPPSTGRTASPSRRRSWPR